MKSLGAAVSIAAVTLGLAPASGSAAGQQGITFHGTVNISQEPTGSGASGAATNPGTWTGSGAVAGSFTGTEQIFGGGPHVTAIDTLNGTGGTITIDQEVRFVGMSNGCADFQGVWSITGATGVYAHLRATGDATGVACQTDSSHTVTESLTGFSAQG